MRIGIRVALTGALALACASAQAENWPQYRGERAMGVAARSGPTSWDIESGAGIRFKTEIPGLGHSSPVVWGDRIYLTTAISGKPGDEELKVGLYGDINAVEDDTEHQFVVLAVDRNSGKIVWQQTAYSGVPKIKRHTKASHANSTAATDGKHVLAFFGSEGLYCYDRDGKLLWKRDFGVLDSGFFAVPEAQWGFASSPIIHGDKVIVQADVQGDSFVAALKLSNGETIWRTGREEVPTWGTPAVARIDGRDQVILNGWKHIGAYDLETGEEIWKLVGGGDIPVPTPIVGEFLTYITNAHGGLAPVYAVRHGAKGDISLPEGRNTNDGVAWSVPRGGAYMQTPLLVGDRLYVCTDSGVLSVYDAHNGRRVYRSRLGNSRSGYTPSGVSDGKHIYYTNELGDVIIAKAGTNEFEKVGESTIDEIVMSTPALVDGVLYIRAKDHLWAIEGAGGSATAAGAE